MDAFDADVLIYAAAPAHSFSARIRRALNSSEVAMGSVLLIPELLIKPLRTDAEDELLALSAIVGRLTLLPCDADTAQLAAVLGARYGLRAVDAVHLATAVQAGADRFITNSRKDFSSVIAEIDVVFPEDL